MLLALAFATVGLTAPEAVNAAPAQCAPYTLVALRGNAEPFPTSGGAAQLGSVGSAIYKGLIANDKFKSRLNYSGVAGSYASTPALESGYLASVMKAGSTFATFLPNFAKSQACTGSTSFILVGYSQGAYELRAGLTTLAKNSANSGLLSRVKAVVFVGDPAQPTSGVLRANVDRGKASPRLSLLRTSLDLCTSIDSYGWPYPDCSVPAKAKALVSDVITNWAALGKFTAVGSVKPPFYAFALPKDGVAHGTPLITEEFLPAIKAAQDIVNSTQVGKYTATVNALQRAYKGLEDAKRVHGQYSSDSTFKSSTVAWLVKTVK